MAVPKSVVKINKNGVQYISNVDATQYTIRELIRAALRDCGKLICFKFRQAYYSTFKRRTGKVGKNMQYWVKHKQKNIELQVGLKAGGFYGIAQELGTSKQKKHGLLSKVTQENIEEIKKIQSQYLSAINSNDTSKISEEEYKGS